MENKDKPKFAHSKYVYRFGRITKVDEHHWIFQPLNSNGENVGSLMAIFPPYQGDLPKSVKEGDIVSFKCRGATYPDKNDETVGNISNSYHSELHFH